MIGDLLFRTWRGPSRLLPLDALRGENAVGGRMPEITCPAISPALARRLADACPTAAMRCLGGTTTPDLGRPPVGRAVAELRSPATDARWRSGRPQVAANGTDESFFELDYALCVGCGRCAAAAPEAVTPARSLPICGVQRARLTRRWNLATGAECAPPAVPELPRLDRWLGRAVNIRQLDAGSCNGCEAEISALTNPYYDLERLGAHFVASPKHADLLLVTGPVTRNMEEAVRQTYAAVPAPKLVVAVGACGCSGGVFAASPEVTGPLDRIIPVDAYIPGCPPTPAMLVTGLAEILRRRRRAGRGDADS